MLHHPQQPGEEGGGSARASSTQGARTCPTPGPQGLGGPAPAPPQSGPKDLSLGARAARRQDAGLRGAGRAPAAPRRGVRIFVPLQPPDTGAPHPLRPLTHPGRGQERSREQVAPAASPAPPLPPSRLRVRDSRVHTQDHDVFPQVPGSHHLHDADLLGPSGKLLLQLCRERAVSAAGRQPRPPRGDTWPPAAAGRGAFRAGVGWGLPPPPPPPPR